MRLKRNKAGRLQYYDSKGRYSNMQSLIVCSSIEAVKESLKRKKALNFKKALREKALKANRKNPYLIEVFDSIEKNIPNEILDVECNMNSKFTSHVRSLDIVTKKYIIEVKSGKSKGKDRQLYAQHLYATRINKKALVFAPNMDSNSEERYKRKGIIIFRNLNKMIKYMKEN